MVNKNHITTHFVITQINILLSLLQFWLEETKVENNLLAKHMLFFFLFIFLYFQLLEKKMNICFTFLLISFSICSLSRIGNKAWTNFVMNYLSLTAQSLFFLPVPDQFRLCQRYSEFKMTFGHSKAVQKQLLLKSLQ